MFSDETNKKYILYEAPDILTRPYTDLFTIKDELILELSTDEVFRGEFLEGGKNRIDLINIRQLHSPNKLKGPYSFYRNEIERIKHFKHVTEKVEPVVTCAEIKLDKDEYLRLKDMTKSFVLIEEMCLTNPHYAQAIKSLSSVEQFGIAAPGILKRDKVIPLLVLSTWQEVFILDTSNLSCDSFYPEIKHLFESDNICKVIHKGGPLFDILSRYYHVYAENIFDTETVDFILQKNDKPNQFIEESRNIGQCLEVYLNFPSILNEAVNIKPTKWSKRPVKDSKLLCASQLAAYLILLKETFCEILLSDLNQTVDNFSNYYENIAHGYEYSEKFCLKELNQELQNLIVHFPFQSASS